MKILKVTLVTLLTIALAASFALSCFATAEQSKGGRYSIVTTITDKSRDWILEQFGEYETLPELMREVDSFVCANFVYDAPPLIIIQHFNLEKFIFEDNFHGICFDFCCFVKCVVLVWSESHERSDVTSYVYGVILADGGRHAYNYIMEEGHTYFMCPTGSVVLTSKGKKSIGLQEIINQTPAENLAYYDETIMMIY